MGAGGSRDATHPHVASLNPKSRSQSSSALFDPGRRNDDIPPTQSNNGLSKSLWNIPQQNSSSPRHRPHPKDKRIMNVIDPTGCTRGKKGRSRL